MDTFSRIKATKNFSPPTEWMNIKTIEMHTGGEPLRVVIDGFPEIQGNTVLERRKFVRENYDHLRKMLMHEPRGHADMYGCLLVPPNDESGDFGIIFMHNEGYSTMCGHATIAITSPITEVKIDAPCGRIHAYARIENGRVSSVFFHCVPSFVLALDETIDIPGLGKISYDLAYGGAFYAYVDADKINLPLIPENYSLLIKTGMKIKRAIMKHKDNIIHPFEPDLSFLYGTIFIGGPVSEGIDSRNVCVFAEGEVDRCPTGSGVSGRMPIHYSRKEIEPGEVMTIESITGSVFKGSIVRKEQYGPYQAVIPQVEGNAFITGKSAFCIDPNDPFKYGFFLR